MQGWTTGKAGNDITAALHLSVLPQPQLLTTSTSPMACSRPQGWSLGPAQLLAAKSGINFTGRTRVRKSHSIRTRLFTAHNNTALAHVPCAHLQQKGRDTHPSRTLPGQAQDGISSTHPTLKSHPSPFSSLLPAAQG